MAALNLCQGILGGIMSCYIKKKKEKNTREIMDIYVKGNDT